jgi:hypothetical protein
VTTTTTEATLTTQDALDAAHKATVAASAAMSDAINNVTAAGQRAAELEAAFIAHPPAERAALEKARAAIEKAHADVEWAHIQRAAAEAAHSRAADAEAHAHRRVVADEYVREARRYSDPSEREYVLIDQLRDNVAELVKLIGERQARHERLARDVESWPADERARLQQRLAHEAQSVPAGQSVGRAITTHGQREFASWTVTVPKGEIAEAIQAGVAAARQ